MSEALLRLAKAYSIAPAYVDVWGKKHRVPERTLRALLAAMGVGAKSDVVAERSFAAHERQRWKRVLAPVTVVRQGSVSIRVQLSRRSDAASIDWMLAEESGIQHAGTIAVTKLAILARAAIDKESFVARELVLAAGLPPGYHHLSIRSGGEPLGAATLIVAPAACYLPPMLSAGRRVWGVAAQLYTLRSGRNWGIGDFTDLALLAEQWAGRGAGVVGVNPLHALFAHNPRHASPYSPSSRLFLNTLYLDVEAIAEFSECDGARAAAGRDLPLPRNRAFGCVSARIVPASRRGAGRLRGGCRGQVARAVAAARAFPQQASCCGRRTGAGVSGFLRGKRRAAAAARIVRGAAGAFLRAGCRGVGRAGVAGGVSRP